MTIEAVYENGVFRPLEPVHLDEGSRVHVEPVDKVRPSDDELPSVREILARRYRSGHTDTAARVDEHQP